MLELLKFVAQVKVMVQRRLQHLKLQYITLRGHSDNIVTKVTLLLCSFTELERVSANCKWQQGYGGSYFVTLSLRSSHGLQCHLD